MSVIDPAGRGFERNRLITSVIAPRPSVRQTKAAHTSSGSVVCRGCMSNYRSGGFFLSGFGRAALEAAPAEAVDCWQPKTILLVPWLRTVSLCSAHTTRSRVVDGSRYICALPRVPSTVNPLTLLFI